MNNFINYTILYKNMFLYNLLYDPIQSELIRSNPILSKVNISTTCNANSGLFRNMVVVIYIVDDYD